MLCSQGLCCWVVEAAIPQPLLVFRLKTFLMRSLVHDDTVTSLSSPLAFLFIPQCSSTSVWTVTTCLMAALTTLPAP